jgi:hypothetical protein
MSDTEQTEITQYLKTYRDQGLSFEVAKTRLASQGFKLDEITQVAENFPYDDRPIAHRPDKVESYLATHPEQAAQDAGNLLKAEHSEEVQEERSQAELDALASVASPRFDPFPTGPQLYFENKFAGDVGVSFWLLFIGSILVNIAIYFILYGLDLPWLLYPVNGLLSVGLSIYLIRRIR